MKSQSLPFKPNMLLYPILMLVAMWLVFWLDFNNDLHLSKFGIYPRTIKGLRGILFSPFLHGDGSHLWHNTLPILILSTSLIYFYRGNAAKVILWGTLFTGILTWCIGRPSYHIGASGIIYMLFGFLLLKGLLAKNFRLLAVSFFVVFVYGGMIWYVTPVKEEISWEGHLSGIITGVFLSLILTKKIEKAPKYHWQQDNFNETNDPFIQRFDDKGNFIPSSHDVLVEYEEILASNTVEQNIWYQSSSYKHGKRLYYSIKLNKNKTSI